VVEALRYKPEGCEFDSRRSHWIFFIDIILPAAHNSHGVESVLTEMSTRNISWG
jgi:hypothetical protein